MLFGEVEKILENVQLHKNIIFTNELAKIIKYQIHLSVKKTTKHYFQTLFV